MTLSTQILNDYKHVFANDPIIVKAVTSASDTPAAAKLPQLVIKIVTNGHTHEIPQQFIPGDTLYTNISSAFQAEYQLLDRLSEPTPAPLLAFDGTATATTYTYTPITATVTAYVRYLINGTEYNATEQPVISNLYVLRGGLPSSLRTIAQDPSSAVSLFADNLTTKPRIPEIKNIGDTHITSAYDPSSHLVTTTSATVLAGYASDSILPVSSPNRHQIIFRNSLGVFETFSVFSLEKKTNEVQSDSYPIITKPDYKPFLNILTQASEPQPTYSMSTGFIPTAWAEWFVKEVLTATYHWMLLPQTNPATGEETMILTPVYLSADDIVTIDKSKPTLREVKFNVSLNTQTK